MTIEQLEALKYFIETAIEKAAAEAFGRDALIEQINKNAAENELHRAFGLRVPL